jgi:hypothetical protein
MVVEEVLDWGLLSNLCVFSICSDRESHRVHSFSQIRGPVSGFRALQNFRFLSVRLRCFIVSRDVCLATNSTRRSLFVHYFVCCQTYGTPQPFNRPLVLSHFNRSFRYTLRDQLLCPSLESITYLLSRA